MPQLQFTPSVLSLHNLAVLVAACGPCGIVA